MAKVTLQRVFLALALVVGLLQFTPLLALQQTEAPKDNPEAQKEKPAAKNFTGTIEKSGDKFVLKAEKASYDLDDQEKAKSFEGKDVKVTGTLDAKTKTIHVENIEPSS